MEKIYKVLVIDDSPFVFKAIKRALEPAGYQLFDQAFDGKMGLEMAAKLQPDYIFLDITMPEMDGMQAAEQILKKNPAANIVIVSAMGDQELMQKARRIGVKAFLPKPFKPEEIIDVIKKLA
jgi:two-component system chemotaxis response regulator CheY